MRSIQTKITNMLRGTVALHGLELAESWSFANVGDLHVQKVNDVSTIFTIHVDFQNSGVHGGILFQADRIVNGLPYRGETMMRDNMLNHNYNDNRGSVQNNLPWFIERIHGELEKKGYAKAKSKPA